MTRPSDRGGVRRHRPGDHPGHHRRGPQAGRVGRRRLRRRPGAPGRGEWPTCARPLAQPARAPEPRARPSSPPPVSRADYRRRSSARRKEYIGAGDIFQVVPSHRFRAPFAAGARSPSTARCGGPTPRRSCSILDLGRLQPGRLLARDPGRACATARSPSARSPAPVRAAPRPSRTWRWRQELLADPKERAEHLMLLDLGRNDVGRVGDAQATPAATIRPPRASTPACG